MKDFLDEFAEAETAEGVPEQEAEVVTEAPEGPARGPDGKFVKAEAEAQAERVETGAKETVTEPPSDDDEGTTVPLAVVKALRKELQELKKAQSTSTQTSTPRAPDIRRPQVSFDEDPRSYIQDTLLNQKTQMSMFMASQAEGEELVREAWQAFDEACKRDPLVSNYSYQLVDHPHPVGEMVRWYKEQQQLNAIREAGSIEALIERRLAEMQAQAPQAVPQQRVNVPPSLAGTGRPRTSDNTGEPVDGFDALFRK